jgi:RNA ligase
MLPFTQDELMAAVLTGRVTQRKHPSLPYYIYNYAPDVQFSNSWDAVTLTCRGLILDDKFNIVARPWRKFFNLGQVNLPIQFDDPVEVMDKADGSLGILYPERPKTYSGHHTYAIATRGSFTSEQAQFATFKIWNERYNGLHPVDDYTMLFEIVYPANRIVLDYGDTEDLILLGAVQQSTGHYVGPLVAKSLWYKYINGRLTYTEYPGTVVEVMPYKSISEALAHTDRPNAEGFVIRSHNFMVKVKQPDYLELHKLVTNASPKTVWEQLRIGKSKSEIISAFPDEFHDYIKSMIEPLEEAFVRRLDEIVDGYHNAVESALKSERPEEWEGGDMPTRKAFARVFKSSQDARYYFLMLDGKSVHEVLWNELRPREEA